MNDEDLIALVQSYIQEKVDTGGEFENSKVDFKRSWHDLSTADGKDEFLKDTSAIANSFGPDGYIVIGFDPTDNSYHEATLADSHMDDESKIQDIVIKRVAYPFKFEMRDIQIEGHSLSIIHLYPSFDKPHVLRSHRGREHQIFVRSGTTTRNASKNDLELMYWDRKNVKPEYELWSHFSYPRLSLYNGLIRLRLTVSTENLGFRPVDVRRIKLKILYPNAKLLHYKVFSQVGIFNCDVRLNPIVIGPGEIDVREIDFDSEINNDFEEGGERWNTFKYHFTKQTKLISVSYARYGLSSGEEISTKTLNKNGLNS